MTNSWAFCLLLVLLLVACAPASPPRLTPAPEPTDFIIERLDCEQVLRQVNVYCAGTDGVLLLQTQTQASLSIRAWTLSFDRTLWLDGRGDGLVIAPLEGLAVISVAGQTRVVRAGTQARLESLAADAPPEAPLAFNPAMVNLRMLQDLPREITLPEVLNPEATPESLLRALPTVSDVCVPREDWRHQYTIQSGDTLSRIASLHSLSLEELTEANCMNAESLIRAGDALRVPLSLVNGEVVSALFYSDRASLPPGDCTILVWKVEDVRYVFLNIEPVDPEGQREVCPGQTSTYTLRVTYNNDVEATYVVTVMVVLEPG